MSLKFISLLFFCVGYTVAQSDSLIADAKSDSFIADAQSDSFIADAQSDSFIYDISSQAQCTETSRLATTDCRWSAGLDMADLKIEGGRIVAYKIRWFAGHWSGWYVPGINDIDWKFNTAAVWCPMTTKANSARRVWSYFYDHEHMFIICKPN